MIGKELLVDRIRQAAVRRSYGVTICRWAPLLMVALLMAQEVRAQGILGTKHNLSVSGPGSVKAVSETEVCAFCHTPHNANPAQPPLWNREFSTANYTPYDSPSLQAAVGQPNSYSKLCLSCHDGTIAIGAVRNLRGQSATIQMTGTGPGGVMPAGSTLIGTNLLNDHPVSFVFNQDLRSRDGELADPTTLNDRVRLYPGTDPSIRDSVQCTSCHDPHSIEFPKFLRKNPKGQSDNLCLTCHQKPGWVGSSHESDTFFWPRNQTTEQVLDHSCFACHIPHTVEGAERLLRNAAVSGQSAIEETCYMCHQSAAGGGIAPDLKTEFEKNWKHPITLNPGDHKPVFITRPPEGLPENVLLSPGTPAEDNRFTDEKHVECVDCHNPHRVLKTNRTEGMRGIGLDGNEVANIINDPNPVDGQNLTNGQFALCFRCHGDTYDTVIGTTTLPSGANPGNKRLQFQTTNSAYHPVAGPGRNTSSNLNAQLTPNGLNTTSVIKCTDCHNSDAYQNTSGRAPSSGTLDAPVGPHGSIYPSIRRAEFLNTLPGPAAWDPANFNLCFRCHDETGLMARRTGDGARTNFYDEEIRGRDNLHQLHLDDRVDKSQPICKSCHYNIHSNVEAPNTQYNINGIITETPPPGTPTRLINFHPNIQPIGGRVKPEWRIDSNRTRQCFLRCHNPDGTPGGVVMGGAAGESGGREAVYRPAASGDLPAP